MRSFTTRPIFFGRKKPEGITSLNAGVPSETHPDPQGKLERAESILYLRTFLPTTEKSSEAELDRLAGYLGDLPFALNIASGYLKDRGKTSVTDYLAQIENVANALDDKVNDLIKASSNAPTNELTAAMTLSCRLLDGKGEREQMARQIFFAASHCAPDLPIPLDLFRQGLEIAKNKQPNLDRSLQWLIGLGLLTQADQGFMIYSTLSGFARSIDPEPATALTLLAKIFLSVPFEKDATSPYPIVISDHMRAVAAQAEDANVEQAGALWNSLGYLLWGTGELADAKACLERSLAFNERLYGAEHADVATALTNLGRVASDLGDLTTAKDYFERALAINEKVFSAFYPAVATNANQLGQVLYDLGDLSGAQACFERALAIHETAFGYGPKHAIIASETGNLGRVLRDQGDLQGAKANFERALAVDEWTYGPRHPIIAIRANYLGRVLYQLGDLQGAKACFDRAVTIEKASPEVDNTILANVLNNLALVMQDLGNLPEAKDCFEQVLAIDEKVHGLEHPTVAKDITSLGNVQRDLGNLAAARDCYTRAIKINEVIYGTVHPTTTTNVKNLGRVLYSLGDLSGAKEAYQRAVEIETRLLGADHVEVGTDVHNLGMVLFEMGELNEARDCYERALNIFEKKLAPDNTKRVKVQQHLDRVKKRLKTS